MALVTSVRPRGLFKLTNDDFVVDEIPAYAPSGAGDHVYIHFRKRGLTTDEATKAIARALDVPLREMGVAGMKDKAAVTTQWMSVLSRDPEAEARARALALPGVEVLDVARHGNKLRTGHLEANRFTIVVRDVAADALAEVRAAFEKLAREGLPNAFGAQRFGRDGDNADRARSWLTGKTRAPGDPKLRRLHFSALQSAIFNAVLDARVADGSWNVPVLGDLLKKEDTGGMFVCTDVQTDRARAAEGAVCPTGPIVGDKMRWPEGEARALEERISAPLLEGIDLQRARSLGEGTRRALRLRITEPSFEELMKCDDAPGAASAEHRGAFRVRFVLPKGAFATTVLAGFVDVSEPPRTGRESNKDERAGIEANATQAQDEAQPEEE